MLPELFNIPGTSITVHSYGLMLVIGLLCASELARYLARRFGLRGELFINAGLLAVFSGVIGARLSHVLENLSSFTRSDLSVWQNFLNIIDIPSGGLTYYGGFLFATPVLIAYAIYHKVPVRRGMDIIAPCLVLGLAFGRIGCLLNGCCWGEVCETGPAITFPYHSPPYMEQVASGQIKNVPDALYVTTESGGSRLITPDELRAKAALAPLAQAQHSLPVHPSQAYSAITGFILTALLVAFLTLAPAPGRVFALMLILEGGTRFLLEMLRVEPAILGTGTHKLSFLPPMSVSMVIAACLFVAGIVLWLTFKSSRREEKPSELIK